LTRKGFLIEEPGMTYLAAPIRIQRSGHLRAAACTYRIVLGPRAGKKVLSLQNRPNTRAATDPRALCRRARL
jgi:hypothetical protein